MVPYIITTDGLTFIADGRPVSIASDHDKFAKLVELVKSGADAQQLMDTIEEERRAIEEAIKSADCKLSEALEIIDGVLRYQGEALHIYVGDKLVEMVRQGFNVKPVVAFIERLMKNPSNRAVNHLYAFLEHGKNALTEDGKFIAFKAIRADWKDIHSGTYDNSIGEEIEMPRWKVDEDPNRTCSAGLHVCSFDYLPSFANANGHVVLVEVDPADVVAIPVDYNNTKMRVCKYKVIGEYADYYKERGDLIAGTALYMGGAFAVRVRNNDSGEFEVIEAFDTLSEAAQEYDEVNEEGENYHVQLINTTSGKVLDEQFHEDARESDDHEHHDDEFPATFSVRAFESLADFEAKLSKVDENDFGDEDSARERARELMEDYAIVQVTDSDDDVIKTYGFIG